MIAAGGRYKCTWRDRVRYFWMYYSIPVVLVAIALAAVISYIHAGATARPSALNVMLLDAGMNVREDELQTSFMDAAGIDSNEYSVAIQTSLMLEGSTETYQMASIARLYADAGTGDLDVAAMRESNFAHYTRADMFLDLRELFSAQELAAFPALYTDADGRVLGIYCTDMGKIRAAGGYSSGEQGVIGVLYNCEHPENAIAFLHYLNAAEGCE